MGQPTPRRRCPLWLTVASVTILCVAGSACGGTSRHPGTTATTGQGQRRAVASTPGYQWSRASALPELGGGPSSTIAATLPPALSDGSWLAAGSTTNLAGGVTATAWSSTDALHWHATTLGPAGVNSQIRAATQWGSRQLAVGAIGTGATQRAAVWLSAGAGQPLLPVNNETPFAAPQPTGGPSVAADAGAQMNAVATGALGIFASGTVNGQLAMWYSSDGTRWTQLSGAERVINSAAQPAINDLLVAANGVWAVGSVHNGTQSNAAVWTSTDGIHWYRVMSAQGTLAADGDRVINSIATLGTGFVAVGGVRTTSQWLPASWISPDGVSWSQASEAFPESPRPTTDNIGAILSSVTDDLGVGLVAVGGSPSAQRVWTSTDGQSWSEVALPSTAADATNWHLGVVAALGSTKVVADDTVGAPRLLVDTNGAWREVTADPAQFGTPAALVTPTSLVSDGGVLYLAVDIRVRSQALGHDTYNAAVLSSTDGSSWRVDHQGGVFAGHQIHSLLAVQTGLLAAGDTLSSDAASSIAAVWSSPDGLAWSPVKAAPGAFGGPGAASSIGSTSSSSPTPAASVPRTTASKAARSPTTRSKAAPTPTTRSKADPSPTTGSKAAPSPTTGSKAAPTPTTGSKAAPTPTAAAPTTAAPTTVDPATVALSGPATLNALARVGSTVVALGQAGSGPPSAPGQPLAAPAAAWFDDAGTWKAEGALDPQPSLVTEVTAAACGGPQSMVAVGASVGGTPGTEAAAWLSTDGRGWQAATVSPTPSSGSAEGMAGCLSTGNGYLAYGASPGASGTSDPALWQSEDGTSWTRQPIVAFAGSNGGPITDLALHGTTWLATSGDAQSDGPPDDPTAATAFCSARLWQSGDAGSTWDALDTTSAPWTASQTATANLIGFVDSSPIVVGTADGRLTVWVGQGTSS